MATLNLRSKSAAPQEEPHVPHLTPEQMGLINHADRSGLKDALNAIRATSDVLEYLGESVKDEGAKVGVIFVGFGEVLKVIHDRVARELEAEEPRVKVVGSAAPAEEKTKYTVVLTNAGSNKINAIKAVREGTTLGLKEAKDIVDSAPTTVREGLSMEEADTIKKRFEDAGAKVEIKAIRL